MPPAPSVKEGAAVTGQRGVNGGWAGAVGWEFLPQSALGPWVLSVWEAGSGSAGVWGGAVRESPRGKAGAMREKEGTPAPAPSQGAPFPSLRFPRRGLSWSANPSLPVSSALQLTGSPHPRREVFSVSAAPAAPPWLTGPSVSLQFESPNKQTQPHAYALIRKGTCFWEPRGRNDRNSRLPCEASPRPLARSQGETSLSLDPQLRALPSPGLGTPAGLGLG